MRRSGTTRKGSSASKRWVGLFWNACARQQQQQQPASKEGAHRFLVIAGRAYASLQADGLNGSVAAAPAPACCRTAAVRHRVCATHRDAADAGGWVVGCLLGLPQGQMRGWLCVVHPGWGSPHLWCSGRPPTCWPCAADLLGAMHHCHC